MPFRATRLRIQIPCGGASIFEIGAGGCGDSPQSAVCPGPPPPPPPPPPPCGVPSHFFPEHPFDAVVFPEVNQRFVLEPEHLPMLKRQLELKLKMVEVAEHASATARQQVEAHLKDVETVEKALRERPSG